MKHIPFSFIHVISERGVVDTSRTFHHADLVISGRYSVDDDIVIADVDSIKDGDKELLHHYKDLTGHVPDKYQDLATLHCEKMEGIDRFEEAEAMMPDYDEDSIMGIANTINRLRNNLVKSLPAA